MHSELFYTIKEYYDDRLWSKAKVRFTMVKGKITEEEYKEIVGEDY